MLLEDVETDAMSAGRLADHSRSLELDSSLQSGLTAISVLAFISFFSTSILFFYLTYKLIWHYIRRSREENQRGRKMSTQPIENTKGLQRRVDFALGIDGIFADGNESDQKPVAPNRRSNDGGFPVKRTRQPPNQFLVLIFNLLLADMHQGVAFFLNAEWLRHDEIRVGSGTCFAQGLFVSTGDLASSCFITAIAVHTYLSVVRRYTMPHRVLYVIVGSLWLFVYSISTIPIAATRNGAHYGGFFVRAGAWCWMNIEYSNMRLLTHYLFIFIGIATTSALYLAIFISLRRQAGLSPTRSNSTTNSAEVSQLNLSHNPAFLIYPVIYVLCTLPLALGRIASMAGAQVPLGYMCFAGAMIASNGMFDCMLFGTTRNVIVFASKNEVDRADTGLNTFTFMQTPSTRRYGNMVWVQGGNERAIKQGEDKTTGGWWSWQKLGGESDGAPRGHRRTGSRSVSQESLRGQAAIQMDTVTTVVVELEQDKERDPRYPDPAASASPSVNSTDKDYPGLGGHMR